MRSPSGTRSTISSSCLLSFKHPDQAIFRMTTGASTLAPSFMRMPVVDIRDMDMCMLGRFMKVLVAMAKKRG